jgi:two-component system response regulator HydG
MQTHTTPFTDSSDAPEQRRSALGSLRGASRAMNRLYRHIERVAATDAPVLIQGESGTGKELVARTIHALSARSARPFVPVNCGAIVPALVEAELFGHEKGSFTGAIERRAGYFEHASGGTLFLDEISEMAPAMQVKLLHVLETRRLLRVGGTDPIPVDVRIIAATHRDLDEAQRSGAFRRDLLYRLAVFPLRVPPLREREGDVELLARHFVEELNAREQAHKQLSRRSLDALRGNPWSGNVRELRNAVQRAYILAERQIEVGAGGPAPRPRVRHAEGALSFGVGTSLADAQREILLATLEHFGGDKRRTAEVLGISLKTLYNRLGAYGDTVHVRRRPSLPKTGTGH